MALSSAAVVPRRPRGALLRWGRLPTGLRFALLLGALIGLWQAYVSISNVNPLLFSSPRDVGEAFWDGWRDGTLGQTTWTTLQILAEGIGIGILVAIVLNVFATLTQIGEDLLALLTAILNPLPGVAVLPLAILGVAFEAVFRVLERRTIVRWGMKTS